MIIPDDARILTGSLALVEYSEPMAHEIELIIRANVPMGLKSPDPIDGATSNIRPPNPALIR